MILNEIVATTVKPWSFSYALKILRGPRMMKLCRKSELLSLQHFCDVQIEKVAIEDGLDTAGEDGDQVVEPFEVVPTEREKQLIGERTHRYSKAAQWSPPTASRLMLHHKINKIIA